MGKALEKDGVHNETATFIKYYDQFFDFLNVCSISSGKKKLKNMCYPYRSGNDDRLQVCCNFATQLI